MKKSLLETNPYLKDTSKRTKALARNVETSSAIEGIRVTRDAASGRFVSRVTLEFSMNTHLHLAIHEHGKEPVAE